MRKTVKFKFEKDCKYVRLQLFTITIVVFMFTFLANKIFEQQVSYHLNTSLLLLLNAIVSGVLLSFIVNEVHMESDTLVFKNIYGMTLKRVDGKNIKVIKIIYTEIPNRLWYIFSMIGTKYERMIQVRFFLEDSKRYTFNGNILSNTGLQKLRKK